MKFDIRKFCIVLANMEMSTSDIVSLTGISKSSICAYKNGTRNPKPETIGKIAKALNVDVTEIIQD